MWKMNESENKAYEKGFNQGFAQGCMQTIEMVEKFNADALKEIKHELKKTVDFEKADVYVEFCRLLDRYFGKAVKKGD
jgi:flagellar biosynthesis/type III secretory pathway protein FliH